MSSTTTATRRKRVSQEPEQPKPAPEPKKWVMPRPARGQVIIYYHRGTTSERNADIGFVTSVSESQISVAFRSVGYDDVYHRDDPRLKKNPDLINDIDGLWDFTKDHIDLDERLSEIERRLDALES